MVPRTHLKTTQYKLPPGTYKINCLTSNPLDTIPDYQNISLPPRKTPQRKSPFKTPHTRSQNTTLDEPPKPAKKTRRKNYKRRTHKQPSRALINKLTDEWEHNGLSNPCIPDLTSYGIHKEDLMADSIVATPKFQAARALQELPKPTPKRILNTTTKKYPKNPPNHPSLNTKRTHT